MYFYTLDKKQSIFHGTILSYLSTDESSGGEQIQINYYTLDNIHIPWFQLRLWHFAYPKRNLSNNAKYRIEREIYLYPI